jgi:4,5-DOPA dioxygenase extradiol
MNSRMPVVYLSHGTPLAAIEKDEYTRALRRAGEELPTPQAIVIVSAHAEAPAPVRVTSAERPRLVYDFHGFPEELYRLQYPSPGRPDLADEIVVALRAAGIRALPDPVRGLDHGAWVPLLHAYPAADIPVLEVTLPVPRIPEDLLAIGRALAPLRDRGVLLIGSGGVVHNLGRVRFGETQAPVDPWARSFDDWVRARVETLDVPGLLEYRAAPGAALAVPTTEHFDPLFMVMGAALPGDRVVDLHEGFRYGNLSLRCFALTPAA